MHFAIEYVALGSERKQTVRWHPLRAFFVRYSYIWETIKQHLYDKQDTIYCVIKITFF